MNIVIIDDDKPAIEEIIYFLKEYEVTIKGIYVNPYEALRNLKQDKPDLIFLDIHMEKGSGIELAKEIQKEQRGVMIVFITAYSQYALHAYQVHPLDYILKPINRDSFHKMMQFALKLYHIIQTAIVKREEQGSRNSLKINCFGKFEIRDINGEVIKFKTKKAKELLSYYICNIDKTIYRDEKLRTVFKENDLSKCLNNFYVTLHRLRTMLEEIGFDKTTCYIKEGNGIYIKEGICNFVDFMRFITHNKSLHEENIVMCENIIMQYHGELFSDLDEIWIDEIRIWVDMQMEELILKMAIYYVKHLKYDKAEQVLNHLIEFNPISTMAYEMLLDLYFDTDNKKGYQILFYTYQRLMREEYDLEVKSKYSFKINN